VTTTRGNREVNVAPLSTFISWILGNIPHLSSGGVSRGGSRPATKEPVSGDGGAGVRRRRSRYSSRSETERLVSPTRNVSQIGSKKLVGTPTTFQYAGASEGNGGGKDADGMFGETIDNPIPFSAAIIRNTTRDLLDSCRPEKSGGPRNFFRLLWPFAHMRKKTKP